MSAMPRASGVCRTARQRRRGRGMEFFSVSQRVQRGALLRGLRHGPRLPVSHLPRPSELVGRPQPRVPGSNQVRRHSLRQHGMLVLSGAAALHVQIREESLPALLQMSLGRLRLFSMGGSKKRAARPGNGWCCVSIRPAPQNRRGNQRRSSPLKPSRASALLKPPPATRTSTCRRTSNG